MKRIYYVVGIADTRGEFYPEGVTTSKAKADELVKKLSKSLSMVYSRQWVQIKEVSGI